MKEMMKEQSQNLNAYCAKLGQNPLLVQGAGGNVSWKDDDTLWIKASGTWIAEAEDKDIFVPVNLCALRSELNKENFVISPKTDVGTLRPSIETLLHALMPQKIVVHLHAIEPLAHLVRQDVRKTLPDLMGSMTNWVCVDYFKPGVELAIAIFNELQGTPNAEIVFMINHGIVIGADSITEIDSILDLLISRTVTTPFIIDNALPPPAKDDLAGIGYSPCLDGGVNQLALHKGLFSRLKCFWVLYPDHLVFLGVCPAILEDTVTVEYLSGLDKMPAYIFALGVGVYEHKTATPAHRAQIRCYFDVLSRQNESEELATLSTEQIGKILDWDAEHYRQAQNK